jgi:hypothetical protein
MHTTSACLRILPAVALVLLIASPALEAQERRRSPMYEQAVSSSRVPVTVALVDALPVPGVSALIVRRPIASASDGAAHDVILLRRDAASAQELSRAIDDLLAIRAQTGDASPVRLLVRVQPGSAQGRRGQPPFPWAERVVADLRRAPLQQVDEFGRLPARRIFLPAQETEDASQQ